MTLIWVWLLYCFLGLIIFAVLFLWAIRAGQFRDQERAGRLPLLHPPEREKDDAS
jgi:cbb3-type cytochrome oxidase maturation protein